MPDDPRAQVEHMLLGELQDTDHVREELRATLLAATEVWNAGVETLVRQANREVDAPAAAERLTALVEGLSGALAQRFADARPGA